ncbi:surface antigen [Clostridium novyi A str. 4552]|uniref:Surface antigen n=1 Tax=Clostridium novyi A str. 4552 TaxID=1444289 RepID=A0A0A0IAG5_CLONO|nr:YncE family protein [Clostridium novyi]KGM97276.1 surface antigen [Clostridium novyi A str. 4552]
MGKLYVCNTHSDNISVVDVGVFKEEGKIYSETPSLDKIGPHSICNYKDKLLVANRYNNTLSIFDKENGEEIDNHFIGMNCNEVVEYKDKAYVICGDSNNVVVFNLKTNLIEEEIPCGDFPKSIEINKHKKIILISNFKGDSITLIDLEDSKNIRNIRVGSYPTKASFTVDGEHIIVCESNMGGDMKGSLSIISLKGLKLFNKILVGKHPVDMYVNSSCGFVSNFGDGTISIVDINNYKEIKKINVGGMPKGIIKLGESIYVGDNYNNLLIKADLIKENKKVISIGGEPTGMTYI